ncbi:phospholipase D-like domain-containing protein [Actinoplanes cyaneus]|uniref:phospholipase D-like domain-containing protein n=1 Tax=Actinoplanes cyaneus TaxID=52696 RepID=UPI001944005A|nr:phospholipase D-like domain-containing protein [Actinoplanes cyaneus]MCW2140600.1 PLD-like domain-containing protein [Actinoplanes cyaneus]
MRRLWTALVSLAVAGVAAFVPSPATAAEPDPVIGGAVFNNPAGAVTAQYAIYQQLARIIDRVPAGETIRMSWLDFSNPVAAGEADTAERPNLVERLKAAHQRGVNVQIILNYGSYDDDAGKRFYPGLALAGELGTDVAASSFLMFCRDKTGCIAKQPSYGVLAYNHNKFLLASRVVLNGGASVSNVTFQSSGNLTVWDAETAFNNSITWSEASSYANYVTYFNDQKRYGPLATGDEDYYHVGSTNDMYKTHFFPRAATDGNPGQTSTDTMISVLNSVTCSYKGASDGLTHQTDVRVVIWGFSRTELAKKLASLAKAGCWVDVVYAGGPSDDPYKYTSENVVNALKAGGANVGLHSCAVSFNGRALKPHSKYTLIDGQYDDDQIPRVFTGSANYTFSSLRGADETIVRVRSADIHRQYLTNFYKVRDTCSGKIPPS